jgi:hypothetical protein
MTRRKSHGKVPRSPKNDVAGTDPEMDHGCVSKKQ